MKTITDGIVIREQSVMEADKAITILTRDNGVIHAYAANAKNIKYSKSTATGLLTYSQFVLYRSRDSYRVDEAHAKEVFMGLRSDVVKLSLAQYFCELAGVVVPEEERSEEQLRLILNALYLLSRGSKPPTFLKAAVELRLMALSGFMPNLVSCVECGAYEHEQMTFLPDDGSLLCGGCKSLYKAKQPEQYRKEIVTGIGVTAAMRHCVYAEFDKLFAFTISEASLPLFEKAAEEYVLSQLDRSFKTLEFYKTMARS